MARLITQISRYFKCITVRVLKLAVVRLTVLVSCVKNACEGGGETGVAIGISIHSQGSAMKIAMSSLEESKREVSPK